MTALRIFLLIVTFACAAPASIQAGLKAAQPAAEEVIAEDLVLLSAEFGLVDKAGDGTVTITPTDSIPMAEGKSYGWRLRFRTQKAFVHLREELELPVAPKAWNTPYQGDAFQVSPDGRTGTTQAPVMLQNGTLMHGWGFAPGDPMGDHVVRLFIEGKLVRTFKFKVVPAK